MPASYISLLLGVGILKFSVWNTAFWKEKSNVIWDVLVGFSVASGWIDTHLIAQVGFSGLSPVSHGFTAPMDSAISYFMTSSEKTLNFGIGSVCRVWTGALTGSLMKGHSRLEACEDPRELQRQITGAVMMGIGDRMLGWARYFCDGVAVDKRTAGVILYIHRRVLRPEPSDFRAIGLNKERRLHVK